MPLKRSARLPRRFNRPVTRQTRAFAERRHRRYVQKRHERVRRLLRRMEKIFSDWSKMFRRWLILLGIGFVLLGLALFLFFPIVQVREIRVVRSDLRIDAEKVQRALAPLFGKHLLFLTTQEVRELVRSSATDTTDIDVDKDYPSRLVVTMRLEQIIANIQIETPEADSASESAEPLVASGAVEIPTEDYLTVNGRYVTHPSAATASDLPLINIVDWGVRPAPGDILLEQDFLEVLYAAEEALRDQFALSVTGRIVFLRGREFHLRTEAFDLWFDLRSPLAEHLARFKIFLASIPKEEVEQYIDLRLSDRVVYR